MFPENFDREIVEDIDIITNFDDGLGINIKLGYFLTEYFAFGVDLDVLRGFDLDVTETIPSSYFQEYSSNFEILQGIITARAEFNFITGVAFARLSYPGKFQPYIAGGIGYIRQNADIEYSATILNTEIEDNLEDYLFNETDYENESNLCGKAGAGFELKPLEKYSIWIEVSYTSGFGDMDDIRYTNVSIGGSIYF